MMIRFNMRSRSPGSMPGEIPTRPTETPRDANTFLFAEVGVQRNGMALSVLSMLSQQDIDPWEEVAYLSRLSRREAAVRLTSQIAAASITLPNARPASAVASDLMLLLPAPVDRLPSSKFPQRATAHDLRLHAKDPRHKGGSMSDWMRNPHFARLVILFLASVTLIVIGVAAPRAIVSTAGSASPVVSTAQPAAAVPAHPHRQWR
jgi:hypothetical protein